MYLAFLSEVKATVMSLCCWDMVVCYTDAQQECPLSWPTSLLDLLQDGYFEQYACYEAVERLQAHYEVTHTILLGNGKVVCEKAFLSWT